MGDDKTAVEFHRTGFLAELGDFLRERGVLNPIVNISVTADESASTSAGTTVPRVAISIEGGIA